MLKKDLDLKRNNMEWIKTEEKLPQKDQKIEMTCKHWEVNWSGNFDSIYIDKGSYDEFGNFWDSEGPRLHNPTYWRLFKEGGLLGCLNNVKEENMEIKSDKPIHKYKTMKSYIRQHDQDEDSEDNNLEFTHCMPLPEAPKE